METPPEIIKKERIHYKTTKETKKIIENLSDEIGISISATIAVMVYLDKILNKK